MARGIQISRSDGSYALACNIAGAAPGKSLPQCLLDRQPSVAEMGRVWWAETLYRMWKGGTVTYEYICQACGHLWEVEQKITATPLTVCPKCERPAAKRLISGGTGHVLVGPRWGRDGYSG